MSIGSKAEKREDTYKLKTVFEVYIEEEEEDGSSQMMIIMWLDLHQRRARLTLLK